MTIMSDPMDILKSGGNDPKEFREYLGLQAEYAKILKTEQDILTKTNGLQKSAQVAIREQLDLSRRLIDERHKLGKEITSEAKELLQGNSANRSGILHNIQSRKEEIAAIKIASDIAFERATFEINSAQERYKEEHKYSNAALSTLQKITGFNSKHLTTYNDIEKVLGESSLKLGAWVGILSGVAVILKHAFDTFVLFDKAAANFRMEMGMMRESANGMRTSSEKIAIEFMGIGVTLDGVNKATTEMVHMLGSALIVTNNLKATISILKAQLGVSEENSAGFMKNMAAAAGTTMQAQQNMAYTAQYMANAAQVPLNQVMSDIAHMSDKTLSLMSRVPNQILRSAIELRRMGTDLNKAADGASQLLDFTSSVQNEMEASVLLGHSINLQNIRKLTYAGKLVEANQSIVDLARKNNFIHLDFFQKQSMSKALGKSVEELTNMVQVQEQWNAARRSTDPELKKMVANYDAMKNASKATVISETDKLKLMVQQRANQARLTSISNKWNQIMTKVSAVFLPLIDIALGVVEGITPLLPILLSATKLVSLLGDGFTFIGLKAFNMGGRIAKIGEFIVGIVGKFRMVGGIFSKFVGIFGKIGGIISKFGFIGKLLGGLGKAIPGLGEVIMALQFVIELGTGMFNYFKHFSEMSWSERIVNGLLIIPKAIWNTVVQPFIDAFHWVMGLWGGHSPSKIGLSILKGITSIGGMLFDALISPYKMAWSFIKSGFSKMWGWAKAGASYISDKVTGHKSVESRATAAYVPAATITPNGTTVGISDKKKEATTTAADEKTSLLMTDDTGKKLLEAINGLRADMNAGKIAVNMDGSKLSTVLARSLEFRGSFGSNH